MIVGAGRWRRASSTFLLVLAAPFAASPPCCRLVWSVPSFGQKALHNELLTNLTACFLLLWHRWWNHDERGESSMMGTNDDNSFFGDATIANDILTHGTSFVRPTKSSFGNNIANILASKTSLFGQDLGDLVLEEAMRHSVRRVLAVFGQLAMPLLSLGPK